MDFIFTLLLNIPLAGFIGIVLFSIFLLVFDFSFPLDYIGIKTDFFHNFLIFSIPIYLLMVFRDLKKEKHQKNYEENCISNAPVEIISFTRPRSLLLTAGNASLNVKVRNNSDYPIEFSLMYKVDGKWKKSGYRDYYDIGPKEIKTFSVLGPPFSTVEEVCISSYV